MSDPHNESILPILTGLGLGPELFGELLSAIPSGGRRKFVKAMLILRASEMKTIAEFLAESQPVLSSWIQAQAAALIACGQILKESD